MELGESRWRTSDRGITDRLSLLQQSRSALLSQDDMARKLLGLTIFILLFTLPLCAQALDQYGGRTDIPCTPTGWFHTQKIGNRWWLCTPLGNVFYAQMMNGVIAQDSTTTAKIASKYGSTPTWTIAANTQIKSWNFNSLTTGSYLYNFPIGTDASFPLDSSGIRSQPVKMPFTLQVRPALYAMHNSNGWLPNPVKNMLYVHSPFFTGYASPNGIADYYDSGVATWLQTELVPGNDFTITTFNNSPYKNYIIGFFSDDSDETNGFGSGPDFPTTPPGKNNYNLGMQVAAMSPLDTANSSFAYVYTNTQIYSKLTLRNNLATQYGTVGALNTAWGSSYTTFDSSGVCVGSQPVTCASSVAADAVGTGDGTTLTFSHTLSHTTVSGFSLQVLVAGTPVAGDICNNGAGVGCSAKTGTLYGPNVSGTINYSTGALSISFTAGHAPASSAAITATYVANGWGIGTGFLDEDDRPAHTWMGTDWTAMSNANANTKADLNTFLQAIATKYFSDCQTQLKAVYPNIMYLGPDSLSTWGGVPPIPVLKAASSYLDAFLTSAVTVYTQAEMDAIASNFGDKPYFGSFYSTANPDSALSQYANNIAPVGFATQAARGSAYTTMMTEQLQTAHTTGGTFPYIGVYWWEYYDNWGERMNWGIVTHLDNAYDGHEAGSGNVTCSAPLTAYTCGGEPTPSGGALPPFGDLITPVKSANALWLSIQ
jgi:hypothetical protein